MKNKEYFWKQLNHVPEGVGYGHFSSAHFLLLGITLALSLVVAYI